MELDPIFQMGQDKMIPMTTSGTPFNKENPLHKHWLLTWPTTHHPAELVLYTDGSRMAHRSAAGVHGVRPWRRLSFSLDVHAAVFQAEISVILACVKDCIVCMWVYRHISLHVYLCLQ
jgi:hypothetical protein